MLQAAPAVALPLYYADVRRTGEGNGFVYAYGYKCLPGRLKVGSTEVDSVQRIAAQIGTSTPDKPALFLEIKTDKCRVMERAIQTVLEARGQKITGGGAEWFATTREEIEALYRLIKDGRAG
jgi:T5orf172 domain